MDRRRYMGGANGKPYDAEVEWIQAVPPYRIALDVDVNNINMHVKTKIMFPKIGGFIDVFEKVAYTDGVSNMWFMTLNSDNNGIHFNVGDTYQSHNYSSSIRYTEIDVVADSNVLNMTWGGTTYNLTSGTPKSAKNDIYILSRPGRTNGVRMYYFRLYDSDYNLLRDMIPVRVGTDGYMYDRVSKRLFGSFRGGSALIGPDVVGGG